MAFGPIPQLRGIRAAAPTAMARDQSVKFLLDTNVISKIRKRDRADVNVARWVARTPVTEIETSAHGSTTHERRAGRASRASRGKVSVPWLGHDDHIGKQH